MSGHVFRADAHVRQAESQGDRRLRDQIEVDCLRRGQTISEPTNRPPTFALIVCNVSEWALGKLLIEVVRPA